MTRYAKNNIKLGSLSIFLSAIAISLITLASNTPSIQVSVIAQMFAFPMSMFAIISTTGFIVWLMMGDEA